MCDIRVFIVGSDPDGPGSVLMFLIVISEVAGSKLEKPKFIVAFFTGKIPTDLRFLSPNT